MEKAQEERQYFFPINATAPTSFPGYTIIIPSVGIGRCGPQAIDIAINTLGLPLVGRLDDPNVIPLAGNDAFATTGQLTTALEVFADVNTKVLLLQQRAPVLRNKNGAFAKRLLEWIVEAGITQVAVLASIDSGRRLVKEQFMPGTDLMVRYYGSNGSTFDRVPGGAPFETDSWVSCFKETSFTQKIVDGCEQTHHLPCVVFGIFCSDGVTITHSLHLASVAIRSILRIPEPQAWRLPVSWHVLLEEGAGLATSLFG
eukprot:TRINITY_DN13352_c0_g1_i1.p1 TRINITY_DN13352_c0_g1~~TRINITY_DN13352_c0_g1_i1.p1  ORF type:complete len:257 (-),score=20.20 TRINITY_DN13352_c0_g1_i1:18-788(-)